MLARVRLPPRVLARRSYATSSTTPIKVAVIGSGPSGFYTASRLLQLLPADSPLGGRLSVDMYERLPTPYGLSRYGVAPDHPEVKVSSPSAAHCLRPKGGRERRPPQPVPPPSAFLPCLYAFLPCLLSLLLPSWPEL